MIEDVFMDKKSLKVLRIPYIKISPVVLTLSPHEQLKEQMLEIDDFCKYLEIGKTSEYYPGTATFRKK